MALSTKPMPVLQLPTRTPDQCQILVVDDNERVLEAFSMILSQDGYQIFTAETGQAALEIAYNKRPDVIVLDIVLPDVSGIEVCRQIKQDTDTRSIPILIVTGMIDRARRLEGLNAGADDFVSKPIDPVELTARVRSLLRAKQLYDEVEASRHELEKRVADRTRELQKAYDRLKELSRVKSNILAIVGHELRTPLLQAKSALKLSVQDDLDPDKREVLLHTAYKAFARLEYRIDDIRIFSDPSDLKLRPTSLTDLMMRAIEQVRGMWPHKESPLELDFPRKLPPVLVDSSSMVRAFTHVIGNAVKFGEGGAVFIQATVQEDEVLVLVRDSGPGMTEAEKSSIFKPLQPGDISSTRRQDGLGIGLALVKLITDAHEIPLVVESEVGKGTTVSLRLPIVEL